jgi:hypothetical protein
VLAGRSFLKPGARTTGKIESMKMKLRWIIIGSAILVVAFVLFLPERPKPLPDELVGVWTTSDPRYADRHLDLTKATIIFGTGKESIDTNFISNVEKRLQDKAILYTIYFHRVGGPEDRVSFYYDPANGGIIRFKNQEHIDWKKGNSLS